MAKGIVRTEQASKLPIILISIVVLIALFFIGFQVSNFIFKPPAALVATGSVAVVNPPHPLNDFTLMGKSGEPIRLSDLRGKVVALFFGYTHCPEECPTTLSDYKRAKQMLGDEADEVAFAFVSVDGLRDTPEQMTSFLDLFDGEFVGMTGTETQLRTLGAEYGLVFDRENLSEPAASNDGDDSQHHQAAENEPALDSQNYFVQHTSPSFLIDRNGTLRMVAFYRTAPDALVASIRQLLAIQ